MADLAIDELRNTRHKLHLITELLRNYVSDEAHPVYRHILDADSAIETAEAEVLRLREPSGNPAL